ncbi:MAG TPA: hypothetical protein VEQ41_07410 [Solirubrobacterales bacterium]|nr:hypothetical protein [Solirubrobacterales bacterium]
MSLKVRGLGLAVLAITATGAIAAVNAFATQSGHFVSDAANGHTIVEQSTNQALSHDFRVSVDGGTPIECDQASVQGTATSATMQAVEGTMSLSQCHTEGAAPGTITVHMNGCKGQGTSNSSGSGTGHLLCPAGVSGVAVTHPNCTIRIPPQTSGGFTYTSATLNGKHTITVDVNSTYTVHYEGGICIFLGTTHTGSVTGSTIVEATNTEGVPVNVTAT